MSGGSYRPVTARWPAAGRSGLRRGNQWRGVQSWGSGWCPVNGWPNISVTLACRLLRCHPALMRQSIGAGISLERSGGTGKMPSGSRRTENSRRRKTWPSTWDASALHPTPLSWSMGVRCSLAPTPCGCSPWPAMRTCDTELPCTRATLATSPAQTTTAFRASKGTAALPRLPSCGAGFEGTPAALAWSHLGRITL